jgi:carbohydrate-selective porin OprB
MSIGATSVAQYAHNANGSALLSKKEDVTDASVSVDLEFEKKFGEDASGFVYVTAGQGAGVEDELELYSSVNCDADNDQNVRLAEVWYEQSFPDISGVLTMGKLDATKYVDTNAYANDETAQFLGRIFRNSPVVEFPSNAAGLRFAVSPIKLLDIELLAVDGDADWEDPGDGMFVAGQLNLKPKLFARGGNYRVLVWRNNTAHTKWADAARDKENSYGWGFSFDQELTDVLGIFLRYGWQDQDVFTNGSSFSLKRFWSFGPQFSGALWGRSDDYLGLGFGQITPSEKYKAASAVLAKTESHLECYYSYKFNEHLTISPDLHLIWKPYGKDASNGDGTIAVMGLRGQMDF